MEDVLFELLELLDDLNKDQIKYIVNLIRVLIKKGVI